MVNPATPARRALEAPEKPKAARGNNRRRLMVTSSIVALGVLAAGSLNLENAAASGDTMVRALNISVGSDGSTRSVQGTALTTDQAGNSNSDGTHDLATAKTAAELPVRVTTAYRVGEKAGSDLSELNGYTGIAQIDITVENLTVQPKVLSYDVAGNSVTRAALVGAPMTMVASTSLPDISASDIVTDSVGAPTNGVISRDVDGTTQVQWAAVLAPPQLAPNATLHLTVNAKNFKVPDFDINVQPGLTTDASAAGSMANATTAEMLDLEQRTIRVAGDVNTVLAQAGQTMSTVRTGLDNATDTLGAQTVSDLTHSTESLNSTIGSVSGELSSLETDLASSTSSSTSATLKSLQDAVTTMKDMLGDTSDDSAATSSPLPGQGCSALATVAADVPNTVYGTISRVSALLGSYAQATDDCKASVIATIQTALGTEFEQCDENSTSAVCAIRRSSSEISDAMAKLTAEATAQVDALLPPNMGGDAVDSTKDLSTSADELQKLLADFLEKAQIADSNTNGGATLLAAGQALQQAQTYFADKIGELKDEAVKGQAANKALASKTENLRTQLCAVPVDDASGSWTTAKRDELAALINRQACEADEPTTAMDSDVAKQSINDVLTTQQTAWDDQVKALDVTNSQSPWYSQWRQLTTAVSDTNVEAAQYKYNVEQVVNPDVVTSLSALADSLKQQALAAATEVNNLNTDLIAAQTSLKQTISDQASAGAKAVDAATAEGIRQVGDASTAAEGQINTLFTGLHDGLVAAAEGNQAAGKAMIDASNSALDTTTTDATTQLDATTAKARESISGSFDSATRDVEGANALLTADLANVLADMGSREGGTGLIGLMATYAALTDAADYQMAMASTTAAGYANVRADDVEGMQLIQAQTKAAATLLAELPDYGMTASRGTTVRSLFSFTIEGSK